jgi:hypothetical protein
MDNFEKDLCNIKDRDNGKLDNLSLSTEVQKRVLKRTMEKIQAEESLQTSRENQREGIVEMEMQKEENMLNNKRTYKKSKKRYLVIGLVACLGASAAICAATLGWNSKLARYFGGEGDKKAQKEAQVVNLNQSDTHNGITVSTVQLIGDKNGFSILLRIKGDNSDNVAQFKSIDVDIENAKEYTVGDLNPVGSEKDGDYYVLNVRSPQDLQDKKIKLQLHNYGYNDVETNEFETTCKGTWELEWSLNYVNSEKTYKVNKDISLYGGTAVFDSVSISPISISINYSDCKNTQTHMEENQDINDKIIVQFMDGTVLNSTYVDASDFVYDDNMISIYLRKVISVKDVESITFAGVTVSINKNSNPIPVEVIENKDMNLKIDIPKALHDVCEEPKYKEYHDQDFNADAKSLSFVGKKDDVEMPLFTITAVKAMYSESDIQQCNPFADYLTYYDGWTYVISYGEIQDQDQLNTFTDILNTYVANIKQRVTIGIR